MTKELLTKPTILIYTIPATGHVFSMLAFIDTLVVNGYRVVVYSSKNYKEVIEHTSAVFKPYALNTESIDLKDGSRLLKFRRIILKYTYDLLPELLSEAKTLKPSFILHDAAAHWGYRVAQYLEVPAVSFCSFICVDRWYSRVAIKYLQNFFLSTIRDLPELFRTRGIVRRLKQQYHFKDYSLLSVLLNHEPCNFISYPKTLQYGSKNFQEDYIFLGPCAAHRNVAIHNSYTVDSNKRNCYISLGTIMNDNLSLLNKLIDALIKSNFDIYIADGASILNVPIELQERVHIEHFYEQLQLLPHMDLYMCGGGINSVCESILAGVPCLLFPQQGEQKICCLQVEGQGFGYIANLTLPLLPQIEKTLELKEHWNYEVVDTSFQLQFDEALQYIDKMIQSKPNT